MHALYLKALRNFAEKKLVNHADTTFAKLFIMSPLLTEAMTTSHRIGFQENKIRRS